jgi:hypothetical protein
MRALTFREIRVSMSIEDIGITGILLLVLAFFFIVGFVKGLIKTLMALITLGGSGLAAWWGFNHGPSFLGQYFENLPEWTSTVCSIFSGVLVFYLFYRIFQFVVNPFSGQDTDKKKPWNFGFPAATTSFLFAACSVYFVINRLRTSDELAKLNHLMHQENAPIEKNSGLHQFLITSITKSQIGKIILEHDPLWDSNRGKLAKLAILYQNLNSQEIVHNPIIKEIFVIQQSEIIKAIEKNDASSLWQAEALKKALSIESLKEKLQKLEFESLFTN